VRIDFCWFPADDDVHTVIAATRETFSSHYPERFGNGLDVGTRARATPEEAGWTRVPVGAELLLRDPPEHSRHRNRVAGVQPERVRQDRGHHGHAGQPT